MIGSRRLQTHLLTETEDAAQRLRSGQLVAFATETVYGLGANALDETAVARIFEAKHRPHFDPLIMHLANIDDVHRYVKSFPDTARQLAEAFWPGPMTLVLPKSPIVPHLVTAGLPNVALRIPQTEQARSLIRESQVPVAAPSANRFGCVSPTTAQHVLDGLSGRIDAVLEGGQCPIGLESTVIACLPDEPPTLLRPGGLTIEEIEKVVGPLARPNSEPKDHSPQIAPGMLTRHYAPSKPIVIVEEFGAFEINKRSGVLAFGPHTSLPTNEVIQLSETASLLEAATKFFSGLRELEKAEIDVIVARPFPDEGLGIALNDRLRRAASRE